ncbi:unnamed protein product, partial [Rotaria magnacalcarata]
MSMIKHKGCHVRASRNNGKFDLKAKSSLADLFSFRSHVRATRNSDLTSEQPEIV